MTNSALEANESSKEEHSLRDRVEGGAAGGEGSFEGRAERETGV